MNMPKKNRNILGISGMISSGKDSITEMLVGEYGFERISFSAILKDAVAAIYGYDREVLEGRTAEARELRERIDPWWSARLDRKFSPRIALQEFGTSVMRDHFHYNIWALALERRLAPIIEKNPGARFVSSDTRFFNELSFIHKTLNGVCLNVIRPDTVAVDWVPEFRERVFQFLVGRPDPVTTGSDISSLGLTEPSIAAEVMAAGRVIADRMSVPVHESDWVHTLWSDFITIENTGTLDDLYSKVYQFMEGK